MNKKLSPSSGHAPSILEVLQRDGSAGGLLPAAERLMQIQQELRQCLSASMAASCEVCGLEQGTLILQVASAAAASKLRQTLPSLSETLTRQGWKVNAIRLRVQPRREIDAFDRGERPKQGHMPLSAVKSFEQLANTLEPSPLREALEHAVRRRRG